VLLILPVAAKSEKLQRRLESSGKTTRLTNVTRSPGVKTLNF